MKKKNECVLICGFGLSGQSAARLCAEKGYDLVIADSKECSQNMKEALEELIRKGIDVQTHFLWNEHIPLQMCDKVIVSPGLRRESPLYQAAIRSLKEGGRLYGEMSFALEYLHCPLLAVTGTNGKTTTTELITSLLKAQGLQAEYAGNIGVGLCDFVREDRQDKLDCLCLEVSSFQLETVEDFANCPCAILNLASDHLDRHHSMKEYGEVKFKLFRGQRSKDLRIMNSDLKNFLHSLFPGEEAVTFSGRDPDADFTFRENCIFFRGRKVYDMKEGSLQGLHNAENIMAALGLLRAFCSEEALFRPETVQTIRDFHAGPHRMELFAEHNRIRFVNDSKGTNPHAVKASVRHFAKGRNILLILGGLDKGMDFSELDQETLSLVRKAFLIGECREKLASYLAGKIPFQIFDTLEDAVRASCNEAQEFDCVMLSPGTASMDMFANYAHRGECFKTLILHEINKMKQK